MQCSNSTSITLITISSRTVNLHTYHFKPFQIDDYVKDGGVEEVLLLRRLYSDALQSYYLCLVSYQARIHSLAPNGLTKYPSLT